METDTVPESRQVANRVLLSLFIILNAPFATAQDAAAVAGMARKAQDSLADVTAIMTDNTIAFDGGPDNDTSYGFQIQPVYSIPNDTSNNMIARAIIPVMGVESEVDIPPLGPNVRPANGDKWGIGPQVSLKTRSSDRQAGPGWGAGVAGVVFGVSETGPWD